MKFFIHLDTLTLVRGPLDTKAATTPEAKRGDRTPFEVYVVSGNLITELPADAVLSFACKAKGKYDGPAAVLQTGFTKTGSGTSTKYSASPSFNTEALNDLFQVDGDDSNDVADVTLMAEFSWKVDEDPPTSTATFDFKVANDVIRGDEDTPAVFPDPAGWMLAAITLDGAPSDGVLSVGHLDPIGDSTGAGLSVGDVTYTVVAEALEEFEIQYHPDEETFCGNVIAAINGTDLRNEENPLIFASLSSGPTVSLTAKIGGEDGNDIPLTTTMPGALDIEPMSGGINGTSATCLGQAAIVNENDVYFCARLVPVKWVGPMAIV